MPWSFAVDVGDIPGDFQDLFLHFLPCRRKSPTSLIPLDPFNASRVMGNGVSLLHTVLETDCPQLHVCSVPKISYLSMKDRIRRFSDIPSPSGTSDFM